MSYAIAETTSLAVYAARVWFSVPSIFPPLTIVKNEFAIALRFVVLIDVSTPGSVSSTRVNLETSEPKQLTSKGLLPQ